MTLVVYKLLWLKSMLIDLKVKVQDHMRLFCDYKATINIAHNPVQHDRIKHVEIDKHFIKKKLFGGLICMPYVSTTKQPVDVFTKGLVGILFHKFLDKLVLQNILHPLEGKC